MSPTAQLQAFAQSVYLVTKGRYFDDITSDDGVTFVDQTIDWTNQYIDELENELDASGQPLDWKWVRVGGFTLGTASEGDASIDTPSGINNLLTGENRYVQILQDGSVVSNWAVVAPDQITNKADRVVEDMCTLVGTTIVFSRAFLDYEDGGTIIGDVTTPFPRLSLTNVKVLSLVKPKQLLILGVAKNVTLPDIVQGGLSPSYVQKYNDLLQNAIARNQAGSISEVAQRDNYSFIGGVGF